MWAQLTTGSFGNKGLDLRTNFFISFRLDQWEGAWFSCFSCFVVIQKGWTGEPNTSLELGWRDGSGCHVGWIEYPLWVHSATDQGEWTLIGWPCLKHTCKIFLWSYRYNQALFCYRWKTSQHPLLHQFRPWSTHIAPWPKLQHKALDGELCPVGRAWGQLWLSHNKTHVMLSFSVSYSQVGYSANSLGGGILEDSFLWLKDKEVDI